MPSVLGAFLDSTVRTATPLALAALGETLAERAGVINLGIEGAIIAGALGAAVGGASANAEVGILTGIVAGLLVAVVYAIWAVVLRADQIIVGTAITIGALGLTSALNRVWFGAEGTSLRLPTLRPWPLPGLSSIPLVGSAFFNQPLPTYLAYALTFLLSWFLFRTQAGLAWRATGEAPTAVHSVGGHPRRIQAFAVLAGGALSGMAGATLVLAQVGTFADGMSAGRGFIAIAVVALGRWHPIGVLGAAVLFGASSALQFLFQATGSRLPYQLFLALPYVLALGVLAAGAGRSAAPASLGRRSLVDLE